MRYDREYARPAYLDQAIAVAVKMRDCMYLPEFLHDVLLLPLEEGLR